MKSLKKTLVLLVVLSMVLSTMAPVLAFKDEIPAGYEEQANKMAALGVIAGDENGNLNAESNITRAEMAVIICKMTGITEAIADANKNIPSKFSDVAVGEWYTGWVNLAVNNGVISGFPDNTFRPSENLTTNQALTLIVKALGRGAFVDKLGAWPGNYVQDAAKLGITKDMVGTGSELANRGNIAILCYNALTVGTWDVTSTTLDGEVTLSNDASLLGKYFKDFAINIGTTRNPEYEKKLVEEVTVVGTPLQDANIGVQQIKFVAANIVVDGLSGDEAIVTDSKPRKDAETSTYVNGGFVVAYVPAKVCSNVAGLLGKKVDVLFGEDNVVALITVVDETVDNAYVTAWDNSENIIEIDGVEYELASDVEVSVFGEPVDSSVNDIITVMHPNNATRTFDRNIIANVILDGDDEVESIDFMFSEEYTEDDTPDNADLKVEVGVVEKISSSGKITMINNATQLSSVYTEDLEDEVRIVKDNALISAEDIAANDVITVVSDYDLANTVYVVKTLFVSSKRATGNAEKVKNGNITVAGEAYNAIEAPLFNDDDDITEPNATLDATDFYTEDVEAYLTFTGEIAAVVAKTDSIETTLGVITKIYAEDGENDNGVAYLRVKILTNDGVKGTYSIYNKISGKDYDEGTYAVTKSDYSVGKVVLFSADSEGVIKSDKIEFIDTAANEFGYHVYASGTGAPAEALTVVLDTATPTATEIKESMCGASAAGGDKVVKVEYTVDGNDDVTVMGLTAATAVYDDKEIEGHRFNSSSVAYNLNNTVSTTDEEMGKIAGWDSLCDDTNALATSTASTINGTASLKYVLLVDENDRIKYLVATIPSYSLTTEEYAVVQNIEFNLNENDEKVYEFTLFANGVTTEPIEISCSFTGIEEGDLVSYKLSDDTISEINKKVEIADIAELEADEQLSTYIAGEANTIGATTTKEALTVDEIFEDNEIDYTEVDGVTLDELTLDEDGYIVYDLRAGGCTMFTGDLEDLVNELVIGFATEGGDVDLLVIVD